MRLTKRQLEVVVDEIYNIISKPIIMKNNEALEYYENNKLTKDKYLKDVDKYVKLQEELDKLKKKYTNKTINGFKFNMYMNPMTMDGSYKKHICRENVNVQEYPNRSDIERKIILSSNNDIPELIKSITKEYNGEL